VGIYVDEHFYDASIYQAQPAPLAVDPGVVYDVLRNGDLLGTFTVGTAREQGDNWFGLGHYESKEAAAAKAKPAPPPKVTAEPEERPRLRRGTPPPPAPKAQTDAVLNNIDHDPERPTLRRHSATDEKKPSPPPEPTPPVASKTHMLPAISTEAGPDYHSFKFHEKAGESDALRAAMEKLARAELLTGHAVPPASSKSSSTKSARSKSTVSASQIELQNPAFGV